MGKKIQEKDGEKSINRMPTRNYIKHQNSGVYKPKNNQNPDNIFNLPLHKHLKLQSLYLKQLSSWKNLESELTLGRNSCGS